MASVIERMVEQRVLRKGNKIPISGIEPAVKKQRAKAAARKKRSQNPTINPQNLAGARRLLNNPDKFDQAIKKGLF